MPRMARNGLDLLIGRQLCALRKQYHLTQGELGKILGVTGQQVHKVEAGEKRFYVSQARTLAHRFSISMDYFDPEPQCVRKPAGRTKRIGTDVDALIEFVKSKADFELMSDFNSLKDDHTRASMTAFVKSMAQKEIGPPKPQRMRKQRSKL